jgi:manganese efflux pump family protein
VRRGNGWRVLKLVALVLPLCLDTLVVAAALGASGLAPRKRLRVTLLLAGFEALMPLVGVGVGQALGRAVGSGAGYIASAALVAFGVFLLLADDDHDETEKVVMLSKAQGFALVGLGVSISLDELAVGFSIGLLHVPLFAAIVLIAIQAFVAAQIGVRLGARLGDAARGRIAQLASFMLIGVGLTILIARVAR